MNALAISTYINMVLKALHNAFKINDQLIINGKIDNYDDDDNDDDRIDNNQRDVVTKHDDHDNSDINMKILLDNDDDEFY